jgi:hypothetical protein
LCLPLRHGGAARRARRARIAGAGFEPAAPGYGPGEVAIPPPCTPQDLLTPPALAPRATPGETGEQSGGRRAGGIRTRDLSLTVDNPRPAARESGRGSGEESALPTELQLSCRPDVPGAADGGRCAKGVASPSTPHAAGRHWGLPVRMHRCQTASDGRPNEKRPTCLSRRWGVGKAPFAAVLSARLPPSLRVSCLSATGTRVGRLCYRVDVA